MASLILTEFTLLFCLVIFVRLFTYRRQGARFSRLKSCLAWVVMASAGATSIHILLGELLIPSAAWPLVVMLAVFAWGVWMAGGNLAGVLRPDDQVWAGADRRKKE